MSADLHERIASAVAEARKDAEATPNRPWEWSAVGEHGYPQRVTALGPATLIAETYVGPDHPASEPAHIARFDPPFALRLCDHADDVLARHRRLPGSPWCEAHNPASIVHPCPEVRALADLWLGEGWDA